MPQTKIFGIREYLNPIQNHLSLVIHSCFVDALQFSPDKRFHRFFAMDKSDFIFPAGKSQSYLIIEISMFEGRSVEVKKNLIGLLFKRINEKFRIAYNDIEIIIFEIPKHNWGLKGITGDELD
ncbi:MAG: tautomerase family protein [Cyanobacteria bacterium J06633_8]